MFQETLKRLEGIPSLQASIVVCNKDHRFMVAEQLHELNVENSDIILEPIGRNTAPALAIAALQALALGEDPVLLVLAADHEIKDLPAFHMAIETAKSQAEAGLLVTFGIVPTEPNAGYGYIQADEKAQASKVKAFVEKPDLATATKYVDSGDYYWNSGMFMFKASCLIAELDKYSQAVEKLCLKAFEIWTLLGWVRKALPRAHQTPLIMPLWSEPIRQLSCL